MPGVLHNATLAQVHAADLSRLGPLRGAPGLTVRMDGQTGWVRWHSADAAVVMALLPAPGAQFFERRDGQWLPCGKLIAADNIPQDGFVPLEGVLVPQAAHRQPVVPATIAPVRFDTVRSAQLRACTAVVCTPAAVANWAALAPDAEIARLAACRSGGLVLVIGDNPPMLAGGERFWGDRVLLPLGWRAQPDLPESSLCEAAGVGTDEILLWRNGANFVPRKSLVALTRAAARLGAREGQP